MSLRLATRPGDTQVVGLFVGHEFEKLTCVVPVGVLSQALKVTVQGGLYFLY
jgi:hypothetical protein